MSGLWHRRAADEQYLCCGYIAFRDPTIPRSTHISFLRHRINKFVFAFNFIFCLRNNRDNKKHLNTSSIINDHEIERWTKPSINEIHINNELWLRLGDNTDRSNDAISRRQTTFRTGRWHLRQSVVITLLLTVAVTKAYSNNSHKSKDKKLTPTIQHTSPTRDKSRWSVTRTVGVCNYCWC
jgi:hypothetical protein